MKKAYKYLTFIVVAVLGVACSKNAALDGPDSDFDAEPLIRFGEVTTKADEPVADGTKPLQIRVYDYFTKAGETESVYINDLIQESTTAGTWVFVDPDQPKSYAWKVGKHEFFGWVAIDEEGNVLTETEDEEGNTIPGLSASGKVLSLSETELPGLNNLDYRYSEDKVVDWTKDLGGAPVELTMKHLSAALTYTFTNETDVEYEITGLTVKDIVTKASATVTYGGAAGEVVAITPNATKNNIAMSLVEGVKNTVWPQAVSGATLVVTYTVAGNTDPKSVTIPIPNTTWEAGKFYNFDIQVVDKSFELTLKVIPWTDKTGTVSYGTGNIVTAVALEYTSGAAVTTGGGRRRNNYFANADDPIVAYFSVYAPTNGQWKIEITGDTSDLIVTSADGTKSDITEGEGDEATVTGQQIVGEIGGTDGKTGRVTFQIAKANTATATSTIQLNFLVVTNDGREISMNSEVTRRNALTITGKIKGVPISIEGGEKDASSGAYVFNAADDPIQGQFTLYDPVNDDWIIKVEGNTDKFEVSSGTQSTSENELSGTIDGTSAIPFSVKRLEGATKDDKITLKFYTRHSGDDPLDISSVISGPIIISGAVKSTEEDGE